MIQFSDIVLMRGHKILLEQASASIYTGHKVGLIGANGCGKSTLFALIRQELQTEQGDVNLPKEWRIASVAQETPSVERKALDYVIDGDVRFRQLQQALIEAEDTHQGERIAELHGLLEQAGGYDIESRAAVILNGLGFSEDKTHHFVANFSGGWRMRLNLAQALICQSDLLLLDEPTNHLDLDAVIWLERWLQRYTGTLVLISHDKSFLDATVGEILSVEQQQLISYTGNYSAFEKQRAERIRLQDLEYQKQQQKIEHIQSFITRFKAKASKAKQAQSRVKQLEKMEVLMPAHHNSAFSFQFLMPPKLPNPLIKMEQVQAGYGETIILEKLHLNLVPGSRIGLLGRNGAGKSTLIKLLAGDNGPIGGEYLTAAGLKIGYFAQHQLEYLHMDDTAISHLQRLDPKATEQSLRDFLGGFGFNGDEALSIVRPMSGGEKARLVLALIVYEKPNLLLLDEPTNHLDLEMRHALNIALQGFEGAMVLVSHDRFLLESVCDEFYLVDSGQVQPFSGDLDDYRLWLQNNQLTTKTVKAESNKPDRKQQKRLEAEHRQKTQPLRKQSASLEKKMVSCNEQLTKLEHTLSDSDIYQSEHKNRLKTCLAEQAKVKGQLEEHEMAWLDIQEQLEVMDADFEQLLQGESC